MDKKTIGTFLSALRKANGMTQQEVADKLNVSNKTVSKWERDEGYPEIMMLPAIAELYSVTVDEILRGERITKETPDEHKSTKSEAMTKYLMEKAASKFTNNSIIAIILDALALILAYTIGDIVYNPNILWVGYVIVMLLVASSVAITVVSLNNLLTGIRRGEDIDKSDFESIIKISVKYITIDTALTIVALLGVILNIIMDGPSFLFVSLPATVLVGGAGAYLVRASLFKKYNIQFIGLSEAQKKYRKKHIKITAIVISVAIIVAVLLPFTYTAFENATSLTSLSFIDDGFGYESLEDAETEYYKLKGVVTENNEIYEIICEGYDEATDTYTLDLHELVYDFKKDDDGYYLASTGVETTDRMISREFSSYDEMEKFTSEYVYDNIVVSLSELNSKITFDDETLTVSYKGYTHTMSQVLDILPVYVIIGACVCIVVFILSVVVYYKKKNKIN